MVQNSCNSSTYEANTGGYCNVQDSLSYIMWFYLKTKTSKWLFFQRQGYYFTIPNRIFQMKSLGADSIPMHLPALLSEEDSRCHPSPSTCGTFRNLTTEKHHEWNKLLMGLDHGQGQHKDINHAMPTPKQDSMKGPH